jgi:hypothetical protein
MPAAGARPLPTTSATARAIAPATPVTGKDALRTFTQNLRVRLQDRRLTGHGCSTDVEDEGEKGE